MKDAKNKAIHAKTESKKRMSFAEKYPKSHFKGPNNDCARGGEGYCYTHKTKH